LGVWLRKASIAMRWSRDPVAHVVELTAANNTYAFLCHFPMKYTHV
jgi:hypothetical protein